MLKLYVIRKYVKTYSAVDALKKEKRLPIDDIYVDDDWRKNQSDNLSEALGFRPSK
jgi:hypothetical protein